MGAFILLSPAEAAAPALRAEFDVFMKEKPHRVRWPLLFVSLQFPNHCRRQNFFRRTGCLIVVGLFCFASGLMFVTCSYTHLHYFITHGTRSLNLGWVLKPTHQYRSLASCRWMYRSRIFFRIFEWTFILIWIPAVFISFDYLSLLLFWLLVIDFFVLSSRWENMFCWPTLRHRHEPGSPLDRPFWVLYQKIPDPCVVTFSSSLVEQDLSYWLHPCWLMIC